MVDIFCPQKKKRGEKKQKCLRCRFWFSATHADFGDYACCEFNIQPTRIVYSYAL